MVPQWLVVWRKAGSGPGLSAEFRLHFSISDIIQPSTENVATASSTTNPPDRSDNFPIMTQTHTNAAFGHGQVSLQNGQRTSKKNRKSFSGKRAHSLKNMGQIANKSRAPKLKPNATRNSYLNWTVNVKRANSQNSILLQDSTCPNNIS